jgi:hypothetical protein
MDSLEFSEAEYDGLAPEHVDAMITERFETWRNYVESPTA